MYHLNRYWNLGCFALKPLIFKKLLYILFNINIYIHLSNLVKYFIQNLNHRLRYLKDFIIKSLVNLKLFIANYDHLNIAQHLIIRSITVNFAKKFRFSSFLF